MIRTGWIFTFLIFATIFFFKAPSDRSDIVVEMEGMQLNIPKHYFEWRPSGSTKSGAILLEVAWPDAVSTGTSAAQKLKPAWEAEKSIGWIYAAPKKGMRSFEGLLEFYSVTHEQEVVFGLEKFRRTSGIAHKSEYEIYISKNDAGQIETYIECIVTGLIPSCQHRFYYRNIYIQMTYNRERYLEKWQSLQQTVHDLFKSFLIE